MCTFQNCCTATQREAKKSYVLEQDCCSEVTDAIPTLTIFNLVSAFQDNNLYATIFNCSTQELTVTISGTTYTSTVKIPAQSCMPFTSDDVLKVTISKSTTGNATFQIKYRIHYHYTELCGCC